MSGSALLAALQSTQVEAVCVIECGMKMPVATWVTARLPFLHVPCLTDLGVELKAPAGRGNLPLVQVERAEGGLTERSSMDVNHCGLSSVLGGTRSGGVSLSHRHEDPGGLPLTAEASLPKTVTCQSGIG